MHSLKSYALAAQVLILASAALALPNGAPACVIRPENIAKMGGQSQDLGFRLVPQSTTFQVGQPMQIMLQSGASYKGLLMYVQGASNDKIRNGNFDIPAGFKSNQPNCDADLTVGPNGVITHASPDPKSSNTVFTWTPDRCEDSVIRAVVVGGAKDLWQVLPDVKITCGSGTPAADVYEPTTGSQEPCEEAAPSGVDAYSGTNYPAPATAPAAMDTPCNDTLPTGVDTYNDTAYAPSAPLPAEEMPCDQGTAPVAVVEEPCDETTPSGADTYNSTVPAPAAPAPAAVIEEPCDVCSQDAAPAPVVPAPAAPAPAAVIETPCNETTPSGADTYTGTNYTTPVPPMPAPAPAPVVVETPCDVCNQTAPSSGADTFTSTAPLPPVQTPYEEEPCEEEASYEEEPCEEELPYEDEPCDEEIPSGTETFTGSLPVPPVVEEPCDEELPSGADTFTGTLPMPPTPPVQPPVEDEPCDCDKTPSVTKTAIIVVQYTEPAPGGSEPCNTTLPAVSPSGVDNYTDTAAPLPAGADVYGDEPVSSVPAAPAYPANGGGYGSVDPTVLSADEAATVPANQYAYAPTAKQGAADVYETIPPPAPAGYADNTTTTTTASPSPAGVSNNGSSNAYAGY
ncbi:hypothetical protein SYNPS1DRAFT_29170 [Syncephalis pseudoplumigaleata]|uniref:Reelin domain-containing protein n=1 Tax=Syncephalis pseudoplumigaleata TaxID=1712513 RepID=A0A4P9YZP9_9FUNG|nr:hypothetical protein SYNPS1DRAFT_29170 [Syncephalis pseudoplumigaleata]|eukprot:RKP25082.1 hypothetical protein SYNPS1DRAFT_29170 [Syncephalis pseudoplumigaleata]